MLNFGHAIEAMENGMSVRRTGWNGKGMYIYLVRNYDSGVSLPPNGRINFDPFIVMYTAQGTRQPGWLASQADMLAKDWEIV